MSRVTVNIMHVTYFSFGPGLRAVVYALFVPKHVGPHDQHRTDIHVQYFEHPVHCALCRLPRTPLSVEQNAQTGLPRFGAVTQNKTN